MAVPVRIEDAVKYFGTVHAVDHITLEIEPGEIFFLLGPSGCGKTTLLRTIAGFHTPDSGRIWIGDRDVTALPPHKRNTGMVFQSYALWPHMTVAENVAFGLDVRRVPRAEVAVRVKRALEAVHMADRAGSRPNMLSGGQQQRVALARALVIEPQCLLLDEPLSNLDAKLRVEMRSEIRRICKERGLTAIYVTHDQKEALSIADRLAILNGGHIEQLGTPDSVYRRPKSRFAAGFIGEANFIDGTVVAIGGGALTAKTMLGEMYVSKGNVMRSGIAVGDSITLCIRPESVKIAVDGTPSDENRLTGAVERFSYQGDVAETVLAVEPQCVGASTAELLRISAFELGGGYIRRNEGEHIAVEFPRDSLLAL